MKERTDVKKSILVKKKGNTQTYRFLRFQIVPQRLFFTSIIVFALGILGLYVFISVTNYRTILQQETNAHLAILDRAVVEVEGFLDSRLLVLQSFAYGLSGENSAVEKDSTSLFIQKHPEFSKISVVNTEGMEVIVKSRITTFGPNDFKSLAEEEAFLVAQNGSTYIGKVRIDLGATPFVQLAVPIFLGPATVHGVVIVDLDLRELWDTVSQIPVPKKEIVYIVDRQGNLVAHPDRQFALTTANLKHRAVVAEIQEVFKKEIDQPAIGRYENERGVVVYAVARSLAHGWIVVVEEAEEDFFQVAAATLRFNLVIIGIILFFLVLLYTSSRLFAKVFQRLQTEQTALADANKRMLQKDKELVKVIGDLEERNMESEQTAKILVRRDLELTRANERLEELDMVKSEFVSVVAHQLRTPLSAIKWAIATLLTEKDWSLNKAQEKLLENSYKATERLINLIGDLLDVARLEEGKFGFRFANQPFGLVVVKAMQRGQELAKERGVIFEQKIPVKLPSALYDQERMLIVFDNLIENAVKYTAPGKKVTVKVTKKEDQIVVEIKDQGIGIPKEQTRRIFNKFFRARNAQLYQTDGTGLGLYTSKNIVEHHRGKLWFETEEGKGTTFFFSIPIKQ